MKTTNLILIAIAILSMAFQSCSDNWTTINGQGSIVTETLAIHEFQQLEVSGVDNVHIEFGEVQKVEVKGHANIIDLIKTEVVGETWYAELKNGRYGHYDLTYYITIPYIELIGNSGTGNVYIDSEMNQEQLTVHLSGTGSYYGFNLNTDDCKVSISGTGSAEVTANSKLDVTISGIGSVFYKGNPQIHNSISGTGKLVSSN